MVNIYCRTIQLIWPGWRWQWWCWWWWSWWMIWRKCLEGIGRDCEISAPPPPPTTNPTINISPLLWLGDGDNGDIWDGDDILDGDYGKKNVPIQFHYLTFFDPGSGVGVRVSVCGGSCRIETANKRWKIRPCCRSDAELCTVGFALLHIWSCTFTQLNSCKVEKLKSCKVALFHSWSCTSLRSDPFPRPWQSSWVDRDPGNQVGQLGIKPWLFQPAASDCWFLIPFL